MATAPDPTPTTMTALRAHARGGPEQLVIETVPRPIPGRGEVLVEVHAAAITFAELTWDLSWTRDGIDRTPVIPSHEFSGAVVGHGPDLPRNAPAVGSEVFGLAPFDHDGAAADYVAVPVANLALKPAHLTHVEASALPLAAATAWQALRHHAAVQPGDRVLVLGGSGAVGSFAVQIAAACGALVTTTVRHSHLDFAGTLGAQRVIDVDHESLGDGAVYDVVIDTVGGESLARALDVIRRGGRLVTLQAPVDPDLARGHGIEAIFFIVGPDSPTFVAVADLAGAGKLNIEVAATYPLTDGREAYLSGARSPRPPGKTVLIVR